MQSTPPLGSGVDLLFLSGHISSCLSTKVQAIQGPRRRRTPPKCVGKCPSKEANQSWTLMVRSQERMSQPKGIHIEATWRDQKNSLLAD